MKRYISHLFTAVMLLAALIVSAGCSDDRFDIPYGYPEGEVLLNVEMDFEPFTVQSVGSRAHDGGSLNRLDDLCVVAFDKDGNLMEGFPVEISKGEHNLETNLIPREDADASNNHKGEEKTYHATFQLKVPYGRYYLYGVANLGEYDASGNYISRTIDVLRKEGVLTDRKTFLETTQDWDEDIMLNNGEMLGYFTAGKQASPSTGKQMNDKPVDVNKPGLSLHCWLRRSASKVTIDFDGSGLDKNVKLYIRRATIHDIPVSCAIGAPNAPDAANEIITHKKTDYSPDNTADHIDFGQGDVYTAWPLITKDTPYIMEGGKRKEFHNYDSPSLFLYENMQPDSDDDKTNKEQHSNEQGTVIGADDMKDKVDYGSYIEVEAYYERTNLTNQKSEGKIIYRFMLGKDTKKNFEVERNYHYKITMCPRGYANDVDWHIDYYEKSGFEYKDPYYVSYLYNHDSTVRFRYTPPEGATIDHLDAEIIENNWWPSDPKASYNTDAQAEQSKGELYPAGHKYAGRIKYLGNGFLSLRETSKPVIKFSDLGVSSYKWATVEANKSMNDNYFYGDESKGLKDSSQRRYWADGRNDGTAKEAYSVRKLGESYMINFPVFTRAKNLIKDSGYTANNPYEGASRHAKIKVTVFFKRKDGSTGQETKILRMEQVPRITNPTGIYRRSGNNENFEVVLTQKDGDNSKSFSAFKSDGPWMAEVIGDANFINLNGRSTIKGNNDEIRFNVRFNKMNRDNKVRNAVIRIRYHNYSCVHLIFVRQGYSAQQIVSGGKYWHTGNVIAYENGTYAEAFDPRDEGSLFKYGTFTHGIDVKSNFYNDDCTTPTKAELQSIVNTPFYEAKTDIMKPKKDALTWGGYDANYLPDKCFAANSGVAEMKDFEELYNREHVLQGFGVLYADGATTTQFSSKNVYGYCRHDEGTEIRGMCGMFVYYWDPENQNASFTAHNLFFPIGRSGYGHRAHWTGPGSGESTQHGALRYACSRVDLFETLWMPLFYDLYRRKGAIYWARAEGNGYDIGSEADVATSIGLDINFFNFDVNSISVGSVIKNTQWGGTRNNKTSDACFVRRIGQQERGPNDKNPPRPSGKRLRPV